MDRSHMDRSNVDCSNIVSSNICLLEHCSIEPDGQTASTHCLPAIPLGAADRTRLLLLPALPLQAAVAVCRPRLSSPCSSIVHPALSLVQLYRPLRSSIDQPRARRLLDRIAGPAVFAAAAPQSSAAVRRVVLPRAPRPGFSAVPLRRGSISSAVAHAIAGVVSCRETAERNCPARLSDETDGRACQ
jgi:hypothetical protein